MSSIARQKDTPLVRKLLRSPFIHPIIRDPVITQDLHLQSAQGLLEEGFKVLPVDGFGLSCFELVLGEEAVVEHEADAVVADGVHCDRVAVVALDKPIFGQSGQTAEEGVG